MSEWVDTHLWYNNVACMLVADCIAVLPFSNTTMECALWKAFLSVSCTCAPAALIANVCCLCVWRSAQELKTTVQKLMSNLLWMSLMMNTEVIRFCLTSDVDLWLSVQFSIFRRSYFNSTPPVWEIDWLIVQQNLRWQFHTSHIGGVRMILNTHCKHLES